jgi:(p)ppGpp synthase/HD superfamily hydrolase
MTRQIEHAIEFALQAHKGQTRKDEQNGVAMPYVVHPIEVLKVLWTWGVCDKVTGPAAVLHDVLEDCVDVNASHINFYFGAAVARVVQELTCPAGMVKAEYLRTFLEPAKTSVSALVIKLADRLCNVADFLRTDPKYARKYFERAAPVWDAFVERCDEVAEQWGVHAVSAVNADKLNLMRRLDLI